VTDYIIDAENGAASVDFAGWTEKQRIDVVLKILNGDTVFFEEAEIYGFLNVEPP
jgi:hypothetical protein